MRKAAVLALICLLAFASVGVAGDSHRVGHSYRVNHAGDWHLGHMDFDFEDGTIILESNRHRSRDVVEITEEYELFVNGDLIALDADQQKLVKEYYDLTYEVIKKAKRIGIEGAKIGAEGARIGAHAIGGIFKMIFTDYTEDDFEEEIEKKAEQLEIKAEKLEAWAEEIEDMADDMEDTFDDMVEAIPQLDELDW